MLVTSLFCLFSQCFQNALSARVVKILGQFGNVLTLCKTAKFPLVHSVSKLMQVKNVAKMEGLVNGNLEIAVKYLQVKEKIMV